LPFGPEVGAVCGKAARTDLCGGRSVMSVPTATIPPHSGTTHLAVVYFVLAVISTRLVMRRKTNA
jgi:hypothetical protein